MSTRALRTLLLRWAARSALAHVLAFVAAPALLAQETPSVTALPPLAVTEDTRLDVPLPDVSPDAGPPDSVQVVEGASRIERAYLEGDSLRIIPAPDSSGTFRLRFYYSTSDTMPFVDRDGVVTPRTDLRVGMLQNSETHKGQSGLVRIYTAAGELVAELRADDSGHVPAAQLPLDREAYSVQAVLTRDGERFGFVRTTDFAIPRSGEDVEIPLIRAVPFDGLAEVDMDPPSFREHVLRVARGRLKRWDLDAMNGVVIVRAARRGRFSAEEMEQIRRLFMNADAVPAFVRGRTFQVHDAESLTRRPYAYDGGRFEAAPGWIVIAPDSTTDVSSWSDVTERAGSGVYDRGVILINRPRAARLGDAQRLVIYEAGRVLGMVTSSNPLFFTHTMMVSGGGPQVPERPTVVDEKTGAILYEPSFPVGLDLELLLGLDFDPVSVDLTTNGD